MGTVLPLVDNSEEYGQLHSKLTKGTGPCAMHPPEYTLRHNHRGPEWLQWLLTFRNGWTLSVRQYGPGSYSSDSTVELWAWLGGTALTWDDVRGYQDRDRLALAIMEVAHY
jgi:hypothetical protein